MFATLGIAFSYGDAEVAGPVETSAGDMPSPLSVVNRGSSRDDGLRPLAALSFGSGLNIPKGSADTGPGFGLGDLAGDATTFGASPG